METICQSCGMLMNHESDIGTNKDESLNEDYCRFCYKDGKFTFKGTYDTFLDKQIAIGVKLNGLTENESRDIAAKMLPTLKRWKDQK